jgi:hypothetical protein
MSNLYKCTEACARVVECAVCGLTKRPRGRSVGLEAEAGYCGWDCPGYTQYPQPGHLWPYEWSEIKKARSDGED